MRDYLKFSILLFASVVAALNPLCAQSIPIAMPMPSGMNVGAAYDLLWDKNRKKRKQQAAQKQAASPARLATLTFVASPQRRVTNMANMSQRFIAANPSQAALIRSRVTPALIQPFDQAMAREGMSSKNIADVFSTYLTIAWQVSRGIDETIPPSTMRHAARQIADWMQYSPNIMAMGDAQKQSFSEELLVHAIMLASHVGTAQQDPSALAVVKSNALNGARALGVDLNTLTLTPTGFVSKR